VLEKAQKQADNMLEQDPTASRYYVACAKIYADLCALYYANAENDYISLQEIMHTIAEHLEYYDDLHMYTNIVENTAMQDVDMLEYTCLSS
jgi:predicted small metal-binding protein